MQKLKIHILLIFFLKHFVSKRYTILYIEKAIIKILLQLLILQMRFESNYQLLFSNRLVYELFNFNLDMKYFSLYFTIHYYET